MGHQKSEHCSDFENMYTKMDGPLALITNHADFGVNINLIKRFDARASSVKQKCNLTMAMSPTCHSNKTLLICRHDFFLGCSEYKVKTDGLALIEIGLVSKQTESAWFYLLVPRSSCEWR